MKQFYRYLLIILCAHQSYSISELDIFDPALDEFWDEALKESMVPCDTEAFPPPTVLDILVKLNVPAIVQVGLYRHTNNTNIRPLLDLPSLQPQFDRCENHSFSVQAFFNQMRKSYYTCNSSNLSSYLNIDNMDLLEELDLKELTQVDIPDVLPLFSNIKLEERRAGALFAFYKQFNCTSLRAEMPMYWLEHNFFLDDHEVAAIQDKPLFQNQNSDENAVTAFAFNHLVDTTFGIGDLRVNADFTIKQNEYTDLWLGCQMTFPTAHAINGRHMRIWFKDSMLFGGEFCKRFQPKNLDFAYILCLSQGNDRQKQAAVDILLDFALEALDKFSSNLIDRSLGQQHVSLGPTFNWQQYLTPCMSIITFAEVDYFFPGKELRFFLRKQNPEDFNPARFTDPLLQTDEQAEPTVQFLQQQVTNMFFPAVRCIEVRPGFVTKLSAALAWDTYNVHLALGYDYWRVGQEKFVPPPTDLIVSRALRPKAHQDKFFARLFVEHHGEHHNIRYGMRGDATAGSQGIGKDFTITIDALVDF